MKPFNLEAAKRGEPVMQRCGREARILAFDSRVWCLGIKYPLVVEFLNGSGDFKINSFTEYGEITPTIVSDVDLFMATRKDKRWIVSAVDSNSILQTTGCNNLTQRESAKEFYTKCGYTNIQVTEIEVEL